MTLDITSPGVTCRVCFGHIPSAAITVCFENMLDLATGVGAGSEVLVTCA